MDMGDCGDAWGKARQEYSAQRKKDVIPGQGGARRGKQLKVGEHA